MRRRQVWDALRKAEHATVTPIPLPEPQKVAPGKGECPHCGTYFARGLHFHAPTCKGKV